MHKQFKQRGYNHKSIVRPRPELEGMERKVDYTKLKENKTMNVLTPICPYCKNFSKKVSGKEIYPHRTDLYKLTFYQCLPCKAHVGCHGTSDKPMGRLANLELRKAKGQAHRHFDQLWKSGDMKRKEAYKWLAKTLCIDGSDCHIGMFDVKTCEFVVMHSLNKQQELCGWG
jgi:hypothetical protein